METKITRKPMSITRAYRYGKDFAANGWSEEQIGEWLTEHGYKVDGVTARRIMKAYVDQCDRDQEEK